MDKILVWLLLIYPDVGDSEPFRKIPFMSLDRCKYISKQILYPARAVCVPTIVSNKTRTWDG